MSNFCIAHGGFNDIKCHANGPAHKRKLTEIGQTVRIDTSFTADKMHAKRVILALLIMSQFIVAHIIPFQATDHLTHLFKAMFPDSKIAADLHCKHTKAKAIIICDALNPYLKLPVLETVSAAPFNLLCDGSNERDQVKLLTILVRLYDPTGGRVVTYLDTVGIVDLSAEGIFTALKSALELHQLPFLSNEL